MRGGLARERPPWVFLGLIVLAAVVKLGHIATTNPVKALSLVAIGALITALVALLIRL